MHISKISQYIYIYELFDHGQEWVKFKLGLTGC